MKNKIDIRMRLARQGLFSCLPHPFSVDRVEGSSDGFFADKEQILGCIKLWRTVIDRTLLYTLCNSKEERDEALDWFNIENEETSESFQLVCDLAFLDPSFVAENALKIYQKFKDEKYCYYKLR